MLTGQAAAAQARKQAVARQAMRGGPNSLLPMLAMSKGKMNPMMLSMLMGNKGGRGMGQILPYMLLAESGMGEGMLPAMMLMGGGASGGASGGAAGGGSNMMNALMLSRLFN